MIEAWDGPTEVGDPPEIKKKHEDYILKQLKSKKITHFYCSEFYGEHVSQALGAVNRLALTTIMSFTAMWLMVQKRIESWYYWIIVDVIGIWLYYVKEVKFIAFFYVTGLTHELRNNEPQRRRGHREIRV